MKVAKMVGKLSKISLSNPQEAFCIWNKFEKFKTTYLARTVEKSEIYATSYDEALEHLLSCLLDRGLGLDIHSGNYFSNQYLDSKAMKYDIVRNITHG